MSDWETPGDNTDNTADSFNGGNDFGTGDDFGGGGDFGGDNAFTATPAEPEFDPKSKKKSVHCFESPLTV
jgi:hypothetical protein